MKWLMVILMSLVLVGNCFSVSSMLNMRASAGFSIGLPEIGGRFNLTRTFPDQLGWYFGGSWRPSKYKDYSSVLSEDTVRGLFNDASLGEGYSRYALQVGRIKIVSPRVSAYGGVGLGFKTMYGIYYDPYHILGVDGKYSIKRDEKVFVQLLGGFLIGLETVVIQIGFESSPTNLIVGLGYGIWEI